MRSFLCVLSCAFLPMFTASAQAQSQIYKCIDKKGAVTYANSPCDAAAKPVELKGNVTTVPSKSFTDGAAPKTEESKRSVAGIKVPNPIQDCKDRGGTIDKELRACRLP